MNNVHNVADGCVDFPRPPKARPAKPFGRGGAPTHTASVIVLHSSVALAYVLLNKGGVEAAQCFFCKTGVFGMEELQYFRASGQAACG